jgi:hypothetical protein
MGFIIGESTGFSTWASLRTPITLPGGSAITGSNNIEYVNGTAFHAGFKTAENTLMRGVRPLAISASITFATGAGGSQYFYSTFFTGTGGNTTNSIDESHALILIGQTVTLDGGTSFVITADYKDLLGGQLVFGPTPPNPAPSSFDIDEVGLLTSFDS